jgi:HPt (histidine-containing phosphotransfer) domain-containing protein
MTATNRADRHGIPGSRLLERIRQIILSHGVFPSRRMKPAPGTPEDDLRLQSLGRQFSSDLQTRLLEALPDHRREIAQAHERGDIAAMRTLVHRILGAAVYCELATLEDDLRDLQLALRSQDRFTIEAGYSRLVATMDMLVMLREAQLPGRG